MSAGRKSTLVDTGPLVALLSRSDQHQAWARREFGRLTPPLLTCEAVLSEAQFLVNERGGNPRAVLELIPRGVLKVAFDLKHEVERLLELQRTYADVPMSLADACLVRMTELRNHSRVMTTDLDFRVYRRNRRQVISLLFPPAV
jgi:predicted nucleic acid-binding protein